MFVTYACMGWAEQGGMEMHQCPKQYNSAYLGPSLGVELHPIDNHKQMYGVNGKGS